MILNSTDYPDIIDASNSNYSEDWITSIRVQNDQSNCYEGNEETSIEAISYANASPILAAAEPANHSTTDGMLLPDASLAFNCSEDFSRISLNSYPENSMPSTQDDSVIHTSQSDFIEPYNTVPSISSSFSRKRGSGAISWPEVSHRHMKHSNESVLGRTPYGSSRGRFLPRNSSPHNPSSSFLDEEEPLPLSAAPPQISVPQAIPTSLPTPIVSSVVQTQVVAGNEAGAANVENRLIEEDINPRVEKLRAKRKFRDKDRRGRIKDGLEQLRALSGITENTSLDVVQSSVKLLDQLITTVQELRWELDTLQHYNSVAQQIISAQGAYHHACP